MTFCANGYKRIANTEGDGREAEAKDLFCKMQKERINSFFRESVRKNELRATKQLWDKFKSVININKLNNDGISLLHQASVEGNEEMVNFFIEVGANLDVRDPEGWTPLHASAAESKVVTTKCLLRSGADVMAYTKDGELPIDVAGTLDVAVLLVEAMVARGQRKLVEDYIRPVKTPKEISKSHQPYQDTGHLRKLSTISESPDERIPKCTKDKTDLNTQQKKSTIAQKLWRYTYPGPTYQSRSNLSNLKRSSTISAYSTTDEELSGSEDYPFWGNKEISDEENCRFTEKRLLERKTITFPGEIIGQACIMENDHRDLRRLILCGHIPDVNKFYPNGISPLHLSAIEDKVDCLKVLLDFGANIENTDAHGWTALHAAVAMGNIRCVKALTRGGADLCATTDEGQSVFDLANNDLVEKYLKMMATHLLLQGNTKLTRKAIRRLRTSSY